MAGIATVVPVGLGLAVGVGDAVGDGVGVGVGVGLAVGVGVGEGDNVGVGAGVMVGGGVVGPPPQEISDGIKTKIANTGNHAYFFIVSSLFSPFIVFSIN